MRGGILSLFQVKPSSVRDNCHIQVESVERAFLCAELLDWDLPQKMFDVGWVM